MLLAAGALAAQDWPQWRGPNRDGVASQPQVKEWPRALRPGWKTIVGEGYSSPVVSHGAVYVFTREGDNEAIARLDWKTGKVAWRKTYAAPFQKNQYAVAHGKGPHSTPAVSGGRLYTLGISGILSAWDAANGTLAWRKDYSSRVDTGKLFTGTAMSPLVDAGKVIVHIGDDGGGELLALDAATGSRLWSWKGDGPAYASPVPAGFGGVRQVVAQTDRSVIGVSAADGKLLWRLPWKDEWNENIITPVVYGKLLVLSGVRKPTQAIEVSHSAGKWTTRQHWQNNDISFYMSTPVLDGDYLYGLGTKRKGQFVCLDARTGKTLWATTGREAANASVLNAGANLLYLTDDGTLVVARKNPKAFEMVSRYTVAESATWPQPVVAGREILVKDINSLALWRIE
jgi:outer membrane protein assembly factor BamB